MSDTVRLKATITWEYDADPKNYDSNDPQQMANWDMGMSPYEAVGFREEDDEDINFVIEPA